MPDAPTPPPAEPPVEPISSDDGAGSAPAGTAPPRRARRVGRLAWLTGKGLLAALAAVVAAALVSVLAIDLGPALRARAEREGSRLLERPIHIGRLSVRLLTGTFLVDDLVIEGLAPDETPFLRARSIAVDLPWWSIVTGELLIEDIRMDDWTMVIESFPDGRHNFPNIPRPRPSTGPRRFVTTLRQFRGTGGNVQYTDHGVPWSIDTGPLEVTVAKSDRYRGTVAFRDADIRIQTYEPMWAHMQASFGIDGGLLTFDRLALTSDGATTTGTGVVNMARWPEQTYTLDSNIDFARMREFFFAGRDFTLSGDGRFRGTFALAREFRELKGRSRARRRAWTTSGSATCEGRSSGIRDSWSSSTRRRRCSAVPRSPYQHGPARRRDAAIQRLETRYRRSTSRRFPTSWRSRACDSKARRPAGPAGVPDRPLRPTDAVRARCRSMDRTGSGCRGVSSRAAGAAADPEPLDSRRSARHGRRLSGEARYSYDGTWLRIERGYAATPETYVEFVGDTAYGDSVDSAFHVTSRDWQESDRLLAGIMTAVGARTRPIEVGGSGTSTAA